MQFKIEVTDNQANILMKGIGALPLAEALDTFLSLRQQFDQQLAAEAKLKAAAETAPAKK